LRRELADLVQEERAALRSSEKTFTAFARGSCVGSSFMPEELRFEEAFAESSAVEGHKGAVLTVRAAVYGAGDDLFSNS
jgi:hypothetical protein